MRADNSHHVIAAAHLRAAATRKRAESALRRMNKTGVSITFDAVAKEAQSLPVVALQPAGSAGRDRTAASTPRPGITGPAASGPATRLGHLAAAASGIRC